MDSSRNSLSWDKLPDEILLQIISCKPARCLSRISVPIRSSTLYHMKRETHKRQTTRLTEPTNNGHIDAGLEPSHLRKLRLVSRKLRNLCLDNGLWKRLCFENSPWLQSLKARRSMYRLAFGELFHVRNDAMQSNAEAGKAGEAEPCAMSDRRRNMQDMANWDPHFPGERVSWYDEYVQRHATTCVNWLQAPRMRDRGFGAIIEARGMALYSPYDGNDGLGTMLAVSPLDDGSVCLWDVRGSRGQQGSIFARSEPDILFIDGPGSQNSKRSKKIDTGVTECVSVNNDTHRAYFAVQSRKLQRIVKRDFPSLERPEVPCLIF